MKKQELVYLHGLVSELRDTYEERTDESLTTPAYDAMDVRPTSIHRGKAEHERAVFALSETMAEEMGTSSERLHTVE